MRCPGSWALDRSHQSRYLKHAGCQPSHEHQRLLRYVDVWNCADIQTHYTLERTKITKCDGGSSVQVNIDQSGAPKLEVYFSNNEDKRELAIAYDLPGQLVAALGLNEALLDLADLADLFRHPVRLLSTVLSKKGIYADDTGEDWKQNVDVDCSDDGEVCNSYPDDDDVDGAATDESSEGSIDDGLLESARDEQSPSNGRFYLQRQRIPLPNQRLAVPYDQTPSKPSTLCHPPVAAMSSAQKRERNLQRIGAFVRNASPTAICLPDPGNLGKVRKYNMYDMSKLDSALPRSTPLKLDNKISPLPSPYALRCEQEPGWKVHVAASGEKSVSSSTEKG